METFLVGGAVRDKLLNQEVKDLDYVVIGSTPNEMIKLGFTQVGADFPVFLHPTTNDEYALARTERSSGNGYNDFETVFDDTVTLKEDAERRDLTINAMSLNEDGNVIDFFNGKQDLINGVLRHVSNAFKEDPVRVLRVARFAARFGFEVHNTTLKLMSQMVNDGMLESLTKERVTKELTKALNTNTPSLFFKVLNEVGALEVVFPEIFALIGQTQPNEHHPEGDAFVHTMLVLDESAKVSTDIEIRFAALVHDLGKGLTLKADLPSHHGHEGEGVAVVKSFCKRLKLPSSWCELGVITSRSHLKFHRFHEMNHRSLVKWFLQDDAFRRTNRFEKMLVASLCDANGRGPTKEKVNFSKIDLVMKCVNSAKNVDVKSLIDRGLKGQALGDAIRQAQVLNVKLFLKNI